jgi:NAD(P)-dependent dehydrogenase (short-subunit alcohol dehydrogenase family)
MLPGMKLFDLSGRAAIITGGSKGLGEAMAAGLASAGADVLVVGRDGNAASAAANRIAHDYGRKAIGIATDVCNCDSVDAMTQRALDEFGRIDILINNAGINIRGPIDQVSEDDFKKVQQTNVEGLWRCCKAVTPHLKRQ